MSELNVSLTKNPILFATNQPLFSLKVEGPALNEDIGKVSTFFSYRHNVEPLIEKIFEELDDFTKHEKDVLNDRIHRDQVRPVVECLMLKRRSMTYIPIEEIVLTIALTIEPVKDGMMNVTSYVNYNLIVRTSIGKEQHTGVANIVVHSIDRPGK